MMQHKQPTLINDLNKALEEVSMNCRVLISPTSINLTSAVALTEDSVIEVAAQNMHQAKNGAFTGEISAAMLNDVGVKVCNFRAFRKKNLLW